MGVLDIPPDGGMQDGLTLLSFLANHPTTARRVSRLLVQRFVSENAPADLVDAAAHTFMSTGGDLREVMRTILHSSTFETGPYRNKVKRPLAVLASAVRALGIENAEARLHQLTDELILLGEPLYEVGPPTGLPDVSAYWASEGGLLARFNALHWMAHVSAFDWSHGVTSVTPAEIVGALEPRLVLGPIEPAIRARVVEYLVRVHPATHDKQVRDAVSLILSSPAFLRH
jgi:uncharacterized protein (DUF1800 family)